MVSIAPVPDSASPSGEALHRLEEEGSELAQFIRRTFEEFRDERHSTGVSDRMIHSLLAYNGEYSAKKLEEIRKFGGSEVYARMTAVKCRGASALLSDIYMGADRPWAVQPTPEPTLPNNIEHAIKALVQQEVNAIQQQGQPVDGQMIMQRMEQLYTEARRVNFDNARRRAARAESKLADILEEGRFADALDNFLMFLTIMPCAILKGPVVRVHRRMAYIDGRPEVTDVPTMFWEAPHPMDVWFSPGVSSVEDATVIERTRLTRTNLIEMKAAPGYDADAIDALLSENPNGVWEWRDKNDQLRADEEYREDAMQNTSRLFDTLEFHGYVPGHVVKTFPVLNNDPLIEIEDAQDYHITAYLCGRYILKAQVNPDPLNRHLYYVTSFEKVPGTLYGRGLPEILADIQQVMNATMRSLVNNMSIASGPQVVVREDMVGENEDAAELYPWKRWFMQGDPAAPNTSPVDFFQPNSNAQELMGVFEKYMQYADEISAIPRYMSGGDRAGGAAKTASGLAMLMGNASKVLQQVAKNIDMAVMGPLLRRLYDTVLLSDEEGFLRGDEQITVLGVRNASKREAERMRQLEALQLTGNPIDMQIIGPRGRAALLRGVLENIGLDHEKIVPTDEEVVERVKQAQQQQMMMQAQAGEQQGGPPGSQGMQSEKPDGQPRLAENTDNRFRVATGG